jgi:hypothetical protein
MMSASLTVAAFILMLLPAFALDLLEKRRRIAMLRILSGIGLASAAYGGRWSSGAPNAILSRLPSSIGSMLARHSVSGKV